MLWLVRRSSMVRIASVACLILAGCGSATPAPAAIDAPPHACRGDADCNGFGAWCLCTGELARPNPDDDPALRARDGSAATGVCSQGALSRGVWYCLVEDGSAHLSGVIVD